MKAYLLVDETSEGYYPAGIYSSAQKANEARAKLQHNDELIIQEYEVDDPTTHNPVRIYDPR